MITTLLAPQKWIEYASYPSYNINLERISSINKMTGNEVRDYILRTFQVLEKYQKQLTAYEFEILKRTLTWSEISKCGSKQDQERWKNQYGDISIHNEASAKIYHTEVTNVQSEEYYELNEIVELLIQTHGLLGQAIRGEVNVNCSQSLRKLLSNMDINTARTILTVLNECILTGVHPTIWKENKEKVKELIDRILYDIPYEYTIDERIKQLLPHVDITDDTRQLIKTFVTYQLWYMPATFKDIPQDTTIDILKAIHEKIKNSDIHIKHIMFQPLLNTLYYDYKGSKKINIYKLRIIQHCLKNGFTTEHCQLKCSFEPNEYPTTIKIDFEFSNVCKTLLDFCTTAENSKTLTYEKSITLIFDMFGFRLDQFDRLNNEESYLKTMNETTTSTKDSILEYVIGNNIVDVGSGGGVLLDKLETKFPTANIVGTDISKSVIDKLHEKAKSENHKWVVKRHNFVDKPMPVKADTIIFSSILHEIYSYNEFEGTKFNLNSICVALQNAYESLKQGGRIIIRDGIKTDSDEKLTVTFKTKEGYDFFLNYVHDFQGNLPHEYSMNTIHNNDTTQYAITGDINFMREFLYTYTWGQESYAHEVQEQFGYLTLTEFTNFLETLGCKIIVAKEFFEEGYKTHLQDKVSLDKDYPNSNCIIVAEKT